MTRQLQFHSIDSTPPGRLDPITMRTHDDFVHDLANNSTDTHTNHFPHSSRPLDEPDHDEEHARRKKTRLAPPSTSVCNDWMIVSGNCHYARDRAAFTEYKPVNTTIKNNIFRPHDEAQVAGVGTVHLSVPRSPTDPSTHILTLEGVLHIPEAICNGFNPLLVGSSMSCHRDYWEGADRTGRPMWFGLLCAGVSRLVLAGNHEECELIEGRVYTLSLYISPAEWGVING